MAQRSAALVESVSMKAHLRPSSGFGEGRIDSSKQIKLPFFLSTPSARSAAGRGVGSSTVAKIIS
jgi:hypothetical protein